MVCLPPGSRAPSLGNPIHSSEQPYKAGTVISIVQSRKWTHRDAKRFV